MVMSDNDRLTQVLTNLISNAIRFSGSSRHVDIRVIDLGLNWKVEIEDYGIGIASDFHDQIFNAFSQENNGNTRDQGGTGLGLKICKELILAMHGEIDFRSTLGKGSVFWFTLPHIPIEY